MGEICEPPLFILATGLMGFCACFQFGSGITWLSSNIPNMSSRQVSFIFLGSNLANCVFPTLASKLFNDLGPNWVFYLTMLSLILTIVCFLFMNVIAKKLKLNPSMKSSKAINEWKQQSNLALFLCRFRFQKTVVLAQIFLNLK